VPVPRKQFRPNVVVESPLAKRIDGDVEYVNVQSFAINVFFTAK
jgi:hypothetical protein